MNPKAFDKVLTDDEQQWRNDAKKHQDEFFQGWAVKFNEYRQLATTKPRTQKLRADIAEIRDELVRLNRVRSRYREQQQAYQPGKQYHGRVWVSLRDPSTSVQNRPSDPIAPNDGVVMDEPTARSPVATTIDIVPKSSAASSQVVLTVQMKIAANWHVDSMEAVGKSRRPIKLDLQLPAGVSAKGNWKVSDSNDVEGGENASTYKGDVTFRHELTFSPSAAKGTVIVNCQVSFQACNESLCLPVSTKTLSATMNVAEK